jgi:lysophospholipid acyltransferase (LPLAT)-like uncharacterized protein
VRSPAVGRDLNVKPDPALLAAAHLGPHFLTALGRSWRFRQVDAKGDRVDTRHRAGAAIYALWHSQQLPLTLRHRRENVAVIVSQHRDGEIISRMVQGIGYRTIRGSSTRGGSAALHEFVRAASEGHPLAITTDGPQGPARQCKPGAILAASRTGLPIVAAAAAPVRAWTFNSWDRFCLPRPGSIVYLTYGDPIAVPSDLTDESVAEWQIRIARAQQEATAVVEKAAARVRNG